MIKFSTCLIALLAMAGPTLAGSLNLGNLTFQGDTFHVNKAFPGDALKPGNVNKLPKTPGDCTTKGDFPGDALHPKTNGLNLGKACDRKDGFPGDMLHPKKAFPGDAFHPKAGNL